MKRAPRDAAVFTCVADDAFFLERWYRYYSRFFDDDQMLVLDHNGTDGSVERLGETTGVITRRLTHRYFGDFEWYTSTIRQVQAELFEKYRTVVWSEPDELVWAADGLGSYLEQMTADVTRTSGWEIVQVRDEPTIGPDDELLGHRRYWYRAREYDKLLVARRPLEWGHGFRRADEVVARADPKLLLIHLHRIDRELARGRHAMRAEALWTEEALRQTWAWHLRVAGDEFDEWFDMPLRQGRRAWPFTAPPKIGRVRKIPARVLKDLRGT